MARFDQRYLARKLLGDISGDADGPLCAIDVDGVLETRLWTAPVIGPDGALALRALARHGYRAVLVTGRSVEELRERCSAYRLAGGAAEYGAAVLTGNDLHTLLAPVDAERLAGVRTKVSGGTPLNGWTR